jgi:hypothetical protein
MFQITARALFFDSMLWGAAHLLSSPWDQDFVIFEFFKLQVIEHKVIEHRAIRIVPPGKLLETLFK